jgi:hypothetical protein
MIVRFRVLILLAPSLCFGFQIGSSDQECGKFKKSYKPEQLISFLTEQRQAKTDTDCIVFALKKLGTDMNAPSSAAPLLAEYLDYKRPLTKGEQAGVFLRPPTISELYPASSALFAIGKDSLPTLLRVIENEASSDQKRQNAVFTVMSIFREDESLGVRFLRQAAKSAKDPAHSEALRQAAKDALRWCIPEKKAACEAAAAQ